jgi:diguanylate cyclase
MSATDDNSDYDVDELLNSCSELRRCISRLTYVGIGHSNELDEALKELRKGIKKEQPVGEIKSYVDKISNILRTLDDDEDQAVEVASSKIDLLNILLAKSLPKDLKKNLKTVKKSSAPDDAATIMGSIAEVIERYISQVESELSPATKGTEPKIGFLAKLFGKKTKTTANPASRLKNIERAVTLPEFEIPQKVKDSLQQLIDQLSSMDGYSNIATTLNTEINNVNRLEQLSSILEMITNAFIEVSDQEHIQFEKFLKTLNSRIVRVNDFINQTLKYSQESNSDSKQLSLDLNTNISGMRDSLSSSQNLDEIKTGLVSHMDNIVNQLNQYCIKQEANSEALVSQMDKLSEQLRATEDEATRLKDDLAEQRVRAQTDPLTNLPNRYSYNERLTQEYNRWRRYRHSLTIVVGDIDLFKQVNDQHGHAFGDIVLTKIAHHLSAGVRESDFVARYGGEEFVMLLPETNIVDATRAINKLRSTISKLEFIHDSEMVPVTMSFGVSEFQNDDTTSAVFERADKALYRAKEKGRNLVCCQRAKSS